MKRPTSDGSGTRLGTQLRGRLAAAYKHRGKTKSDICLHYSFKSKSNVPLVGELNLLHYFHAESDPEVESVLRV